MSKMRVFIFFMLFFIGCFCKTIAQNTDSVASKKVRAVVLAGLAYAPETKLAFALTPLFFVDLSTKTKKARPSLIRLPTIYTLNKQFLAESYWDIFTPNDKFILTGTLGFRKYPNRHYGIGNEANQTVICHKDEMVSGDTLNYLNYSNHRFQFQNQILYKIFDKTHFGFQWNYENHSKFKEIIPNENYHHIHDLNFDKNPVEGAQFGIGFAFRKDTRNHLLTPQKGTFLQINQFSYLKLLNADFQYFALNLDYRKFIKLHSNFTLAVQYLHQLREVKNEHKIPFFGLAQAGGQDFQRGYFLGTFRDKNLSSFQAELRTKVWRRFGNVLFGGGVQTYGFENQFNVEKYNFAFGSGLRYVLNKITGLTVRVDYAVGLNPNAGYDQRQTAFYIRLREAF